MLVISEQKENYNIFKYLNEIDEARALFNLVKYYA